MSELSVQQTKLLNNYLKDNPDISRSKAIEILFGSSKGKADGKGITLERTQFENSELNAMADEFYSIADDNSGSTTFNKMKEFLNTKITPDNIVGFLDAYEDAKRGDNSIIDTVMSEFTLFSNKPRNEVLTLINDKLCKAAEQAGVSDEDIAYARDAFNSNLGDTVEMEKAVKFLLGAIKSKQTVANTPEISIPDAMSEFSTMYSDTTNVATEIFEEARNEEGSIAKGADTVLGWFGCTTAEDMREKLGADAEAAEKLTQAAEAVRKNPQDKAAMKAFNDAYKETFGIEFDANKIAAREAAWTTYAAAESLATTAKNLKATFFDRPVPKEYINFSQRIRQVTGLSNEELDAVIESYSTNLNMPAQTDEDKRQILKQYVQDLGKNITEQYNTVTQGKSLEQLKRDAELLDKSAFGTKDIVRDVIQYNENQAITAMVTEGGLEIAGTVALQFVPGLGQAASARLAASAAKWGNRGVKVANYLNKAEKGFAAAQKFQQGTKFTSTVANRTAQVVSQSAAAGAATATLGVIDGKDAEDIMRRTLMNMSFAGAGATSSVLAPKLMQSFGITDSALANEIAEEIINTAASYGITTLSGSDYTEADGFIDFATGLVMSRISHVKVKQGENESHGLTVKLKNAFKKQKFLIDYMRATDGHIYNKTQRKFIDDVLAQNPDINLDDVECFLVDYDSSLTKPSQEHYNIAVFLAAKSSNKCSGMMFKELLNIASDPTEPEEFRTFFSKITDSNLSDIQISALICCREMSPEAHPNLHVIGFKQTFSDAKQWDTITNVIPELSRLKPEQLYSIANIIMSCKIPSHFEECSIDIKKKMLTTIESLPQDIKESFIKKGIKLDDLEIKLKFRAKLKGYDIKTDSKSQNRFLKSIIGNNNSKAEDILSGDLMTEFISQHQRGLPLEYPRENFIQDLNALIEQLPVNERRQVLKDLNIISLSAKDFEGFINPRNLNENNFSKNSKEIINKIQNMVTKFVFENSVQTSNRELKAVLDDLIQGFPEFTSIIGKQNGNQSNTLDVHILEVLHDVISNPEYKGLSDKDKTVLKFAVLMHDFGKRAGIQDNGDYAANSAVFANSILDKFKLPADIKERIVNLVRHHNFIESSPKSFNRFFRTKEDETIAKIIAKADYKSSVGGELDLSEFRTRWKLNGLPVVNPVNPQKYFPKAKFNIDGKIVEVPVLNLNELQPDTDMGLYGYEKGTKVDDIVVQVHNTKSARGLENIFKMYDDPNKDYVLSTSIKAINFSDNTYGKYGVTLRTQPMNRGGGSVENTELSGFLKDLDFFIERGGLADKHLNDDYFNTIQYPSQIKDPALREKFHNFQQIFNPNTFMRGNEIYALRPRVGEIVVHMDISTQDIPAEIVKLADEYGVPIIVTRSRK